MKILLYVQQNNRHEKSPGECPELEKYNAIMVPFLIRNARAIATVCYCVGIPALIFGILILIKML